MISPITPDEFALYQKLLQESSGIVLRPAQGYLIENRLLALARSHHVEDYGALFEIIRSKPELIATIVDLMTTNETLWFRDQSCWAMLEGKLINDLIANTKQKYCS